jgi:hypothetical protein
VWNGLTNPDIWVERKTGIKEVETLWTAQSLLDDAPAL